MPTNIRSTRNPFFSAIGCIIASFGLAACALSANGDGAGGDGASGKDSSAICNAGQATEKSDAGLDQITLCISSSGKNLPLTVELARSPDEQSRGLMFRQELADDRGMLFPYSKPQILSFWMKNTVIPLDIIFIKSDGSIESIAANTTPYSLKSVSSKEAAIAVLEIRGGLSAELGIKAGDVVSWKK